MEPPLAVNLMCEFTDFNLVYLVTVIYFLGDGESEPDRALWLDHRRLAGETAVRQEEERGDAPSSREEDDGYDGSAGVSIP